jgi:hypothetical protein
MTQQRIFIPWLHSSRFMMRFIPLLLLLTFPCLGSAGEKDLAAKLESRGMKLKKEKSGSVTEISINSTVSVKAEDYRQFGQFPQLQKLWMSPSGIPLNDDTVTAMGILPNVEYFFGNGGQFTDDGLKPFARWKRLKFFGLDHWFGPPNSKAFLGKGLAHLAALPQLEAVRFGGCRVDNEAPKALAKIKTLQKIDLFHTFAVTDEGVQALQALPKLKTIILGPQYTPRITNRTLQHLSQIPSLEEISITETWFTYDDGLANLTKLPNLKTLNLKFVLAEEKDITRLKKEMPKVKVEWSLPDETNIATLRRNYKSYWESRKKDQN